METRILRKPIPLAHTPEEVCEIAELPEKERVDPEKARGVHSPFCLGISTMHSPGEKEIEQARMKRFSHKEKDFKARQKTLLEAAQLKHGSKGDLVQEILHRYKDIPLDKDTYKDLGFLRFHQAAWEGLEEIIPETNPIILDKSKEDVNARDCNGQTPLHIAAFRGYEKVVESLLKCKGIIITANRGAFTPLHLAADGGHLEVVKLLLKAVQKAGGDTSLKEFVNSTDYELNRTALHYACRNGNVEVVDELLKCDINIEEKDIFGYTPALLAVVAKGDHEEIVKRFLDLEDPQHHPFKSLEGQMDYKLSNPQEDLGVLYGERDWQIMFAYPKLVDSYYIDTYYFCILPDRLQKDYRKNWMIADEDRDFFSATRLAVQGNNGKVLAYLLKYIESFGNDKDVIMSQSYYWNSNNMKLLINELMHYAARIGSSEALKVLLHFKPNGDNVSEDYKLDINSMLNGRTAAFAAVKSLYSFAHAKVDKEDEKYNLMLWSNILAVANELCSMKEFDAINRDSTNNTLLHYISESQDVLPKSMHSQQKRVREAYVEFAMVKLMIKSDDLKNLCDYYTQKKQDLQNGCNALLVGATLIAALAVSGMITPPQPLSRTQHIDRVLNIYWTCNSLSFYFAVFTLILCLKVLMPRRKEYIEEELKKLTKSATLSSLGLTMTTTLAIGAYITGEHLNGPSRTLALRSTVFGLVFLIPFIIGAIGKDYWGFLHMLFDYSNWRHIGSACRRSFLNLTDLTSHRTKAQTDGFEQYKKPKVTQDEAKSKKKGTRSDPAKKAQSEDDDLRRGLNVDDTDNLLATLRIVSMQVVLLGTVVIFVGNLFVKLDN